MPKFRFTWRRLIVGLGLLLCGCENTPPPKTSPAAIPLPDTPALFREVGAESGFDFHHQTKAPGSYFFPEVVGSGCALLDYDNDGDLDLYLVNLGAGYSQRKTSGEGNRLYRQISPGQYEDVTEEAGLGDRSVGMGAAVGDVNNDGYPDLYVTNYGADRLFLNRGDGSFEDITAPSQVDNQQWGASACFFDYDNDGWLDCYVTNYVNHQPRPCTQLAGGGRDYCGPHQFPPVSDKLFRNLTGEQQDGQVRFADVGLDAGITALSAPGLGVIAADFNGDHWQDLYVANDQAANFLWINQQDGSFADKAILYGAAYDAQGKAQASMGVALGDLSGDARPELFLTHLEGEYNTMYAWRGETAMDDQTNESGLSEASLPYTGFGTALADLDHDGDLDILIANGSVRRPTAQRRFHTPPVQGFWAPYCEPNQILLNGGADGFENFLSRNEPFIARAEMSRGLAVGDLDNDGDLDCLTVNTAGKARLFFNEAAKQGDWLIVRAVDPRRGGRDAYGATVRVVVGTTTKTRLIQPGYSYLSSNDPRAHFGLGKAPHYDRLEVVWEDGAQETFPGGASGRIVTAERGKGESVSH